MCLTAISVRYETTCGAIWDEIPDRTTNRENRTRNRSLSDRACFAPYLPFCARPSIQHTHDIYGTASRRLRAPRTPLRGTRWSGVGREGGKGEDRGSAAAGNDKIPLSEGSGEVAVLRAHPWHGLARRARLCLHALHTERRDARATAVRMATAQRQVTKRDVGSERGVLSLW